MGDDDVDIPDAFPASGTFHFEHHRHHHGKENSASRRVNETSDMTRVMMDSWGSKSWRTGSRGGLGDEDGEQGGSSRDLMRDLEALSLDPIEMPVELDAGSPLRPPMFSAERHYARAQERERTAPARHEEQYESWASESLQLETLLTENTDDVLMEARQLLKNWVDNDAVPSYDVSSRITTKEKPRTIEELFLVPSSRQEEIRDIVSTVVSQSQRQDSSYRSGFDKPSNPRLVMEARQKIAKERRESMESNRRTDLEAKILDRQRRLALERTKKEVELRRYRKEIDDKWRTEVAMKAARMNVEADLTAKRSMIIESVRTEAEGTKMEIIDDQINKEKLEEQKLKEKHEEEIRNQRIQAKVSELVTLKCLKTLGTHFSAWKNLIFQQHHSIKKIQMISNWRTLNRFWVRWRVSKKRKEGRRQAEETARILKLEHEANQRALRHYCGYLLSKAMVGWKKWARLERDTRIIRQQHEERSRKMKAFMEQLEKAKIEEREQDLGLRENESPAMNKTNGTPILKLSQSCSQLRHVSKSLPASNSFGAHQHTAPAAEQHALKDLHEIESCNQVTFIHPVPTTEPGEKDANAKLEQTAPKPKKLRSARDMELIENMQKRDEERKKRKELLEQKRKEKQEMLENQKREQERLKQESEEAERRRYLEQKLEEQRLIREAEDRKRAEKEKHLSLIKQADDRYKKSLLKKRGIAPWRVFTALHRQDTDRACDFQQLWSIKGPLLQWFRKTEDKWKLKEHNAETFRKKRLITKFMKMWLNTSYEYEAMAGAALRIAKHNSLKVTLKSWREITKCTLVERLKRERILERRAEAFAAKCVPRRYVRRWVRYIALVKDEKWKEYRKQQLRNRVKELLEVSAFEEALRHELDGYGRGSLLNLGSFMDETDIDTTS